MSSRRKKERQSLRFQLPGEEDTILEYPQGDEARRGQESDEEGGGQGLARAIRTFEEERNRENFRDVLLELDRLMRPKGNGGNA